MQRKAMDTAQPQARGLHHLPLEKPRGGRDGRAAPQPKGPAWCPHQSVLFPLKFVGSFALTLNFVFLLSFEYI